MPMRWYAVRLERLVNNMSKLAKKLLNKSLRKNRIRSRVSGNAERPRLTISISNKHVSAQIIDDVKQTTLVASTTVGTKQDGSLSEQSAFIGTDIAKKAKKAKISAVVLDRNGHLYAKRLGAFADAARKEGLEF
jgi:large subunit ribosomal protein L18